MPATVEKLEQTCPACGATFTLADRRKRVQCPRCREVIDLAPATPPPRPSPAPAAGELDELKARLSRLEQLEARTLALEEMLAELRSAAFTKATASPVLLPPIEPPPATDFRWLPVAGNENHGVIGEIPSSQAEVLLENLHALGPRRIAIQATVGDLVARRLANRLQEIFEHAGWTVPEVIDAPEHLRPHPLTLTAPSGLHPQEMSLLFMALTAAGFKVVSQIDPNLFSREPILSVGPQLF